MDLGQWIVIGLSVGMLAWIIGGSSLNRQREEKTIRWIYKGLKKYGDPRPVKGGDPRLKRPGIEVLKPSGPFRTIQVNYQLERRENPPLWLFQRIQGKGDELEIRTGLKSGVKGSFKGEDLVGVKEALGAYQKALLEDGVQSEGLNLILRFRLKKIIEKGAEDFFEAVEAAVRGEG
jgi:hypothetical protein